MRWTKRCWEGTSNPDLSIHLSTDSVDLGGWLRWLGPVFKSRNPFTVFHPHIHTHTPQIYTIITRQHKMWLKKVSRHFPLCSSHHERKKWQGHRWPSVTASGHQQPSPRLLVRPQQLTCDSLCVTCLIYLSLSVSLSLNVFSLVEENLILHGSEADVLWTWWCSDTKKHVRTVRILSEQKSQYSWGRGQEYNFTTSAHLDTALQIRVAKI